MSVFIEISVDRVNGVPVVKAEIDTKQYSNDDIEVKWARLALRYATKISQAMVIEDTQHIDDVRAYIAFSRDEAELDELSSSRTWSEYTGYNQAPPRNKMSIGIAMAVDNRDVLGGMATPAPVLATNLYRLLLDARDQVTVK